MKKVLLIGGSYFVGRVFNILATRTEDWEIHVVNRGNAPLNKPGVTEYKCDRHDIEKFASIVPDEKFDAVIDFCGYNPGDIEPIVEKIHDRISQYIYISTASVYINEDHGVRVEGDPILYSSDDDMVTQYICNKALLEKECIEVCGKYDIPYTIARPAFIYGPFNYAPRESWYIKKIVKGEPVPVLTDGTAHFNFVYVVDVATAMQLFVGDEKAYNQIFNLSNSAEVITEAKFVAELEKLNGPFQKTEVTVAETLNRNIAIPWPLEDDELYDGTKFAQTFGYEYTTFEEGMRKANNAFVNVYKD